MALVLVPLDTTVQTDVILVFLVLLVTTVQAVAILNRLNVRQGLLICILANKTAQTVPLEEYVLLKDFSCLFIALQVTFAIQSP
jgi:hypothetical protein